jgi:formate hydrogenlyase subunit 3/multisubunit Na+/H+ antiporter MnhD subunit
MEKTTLSKTQIAFGISLAIASLANALLVVAKEKSPKTLALMKSLTGHHWITHCTFIILLFLLIGLVLSRKNGGETTPRSAAKLLPVVVGGIVVSGLIIVGFYLIVG